MSINYTLSNPSGELLKQTAQHNHVNEQIRRAFNMVLEKQEGCDTEEIPAFQVSPFLCQIFIKFADLVGRGLQDGWYNFRSGNVTAQLRCGEKTPGGRDIFVFEELEGHELWEWISSFEVCVGGFDISVKERVDWVDGVGCGVSFISIDGDRDRILTYFFREGLHIGDSRLTQPILDFLSSPDEFEATYNMSFLEKIDEKRMNLFNNYEIT